MIWISSGSESVPRSVVALITDNSYKKYSLAGPLSKNVYYYVTVNVNRQTATMNIN